MCRIYILSGPCVYIYRYGHMLKHQKSKTKSRACTNMTYVSLPNDLLTEIMSRVPAKSLARFRSVSKQFKSLLSDHCFLRLHQNRLRDSLFAISIHNPSPNSHIDLNAFCHKSRDTYMKKYNFIVTNKANGLVHEFTIMFGSRTFRMLSSHHKLLCFVCDCGIYLCDPMNKQIKYLHDSPWSPRCFNLSDECLVSFGFVEATMQYKVVKWPHDLDEDRTRRLPSGLITTWKKVNELKFEVLNIDIVEDGRLKVSPWRRLNILCPYLLQLSSQVHVNGFIYWTTSDFQIVSFSLQDETFSTVNPKPPCFRLDTQGSKTSCFFTLSGSRGNLWMIDNDVPSQIMEIWKMDESQDGGWAKIHKIDLGGTHTNGNDGKVQILDVSLDRVLFKLSSTWSTWPLFCYNAKTNTLVNCGQVFKDYQLCHSTDGLLSLHNLDTF